MGRDLPWSPARPLLAGLLAGALWLGSVNLVLADGADAPDYPVVGGHFFRQAAGNGGKGFRIANEDDVPFWSEFERLGGVQALGYPISRRFYLRGFLCQATQRAILQWHPTEKRVVLLNVMEYLSELGKDDELAHSRLVPRPAGDATEALRRGWLEETVRIRALYESAADPLAVFGLPSSPLAETDAAWAMRFQRGVIYVWKNRHPWTGPEQISVANVGDFVKEARGIPGAALEPEAPPPVREIVAPSRAGPRDDGRISGVATWYGEEFHGELMFNEQPFDMWDPTLAASNSHPIGTWLKVMRVATGKSIKVRVSDRGAFRMPIVVDLSYAAFASLADPDDGVIRVVVEPLD